MTLKLGKKSRAGSMAVDFPLIDTSSGKRRGTIRLFGTKEGVSTSIISTELPKGIGQGATGARFLVGFFPRQTDAKREALKVANTLID